MGISFADIHNKHQHYINMKAFIALSALLATAFAAGPPAPYHPAPAPYHPAPAYGKGPAYADTPPVYGYEYAVQDDYSGVNFGQMKRGMVIPHPVNIVFYFLMAAPKL